MPVYLYKARDKSGKLISGAIDAPNSDKAAEKLKLSGLTPVEVKQKFVLPGFFKIFSPKIKISRRKLCIFTKQLATLQNAGVPLVNSLYASAEQTDDRILKTTIADIAKKVEAGQSLAESLESHKYAFDNLYINMIKVAEAGGMLPDVLERLSGFMEYEEDTKSKISAATRYPLIVLGALTIAFVVLIVAVVPKFLKIYKRFNAELPIPTKILIALNFIITHYWWAIILFGLAVYIIFKKFIKTKSGCLMKDKAMLKIPVIGNLVLMITMSRFARILSVLNKSGVPILETLGYVSDSIDNTSIKNVINDVKSGISQGKGLSVPMKEAKFFPPMVVQMVAVGEETGKLSELLLNVSDYYDAQANYIIRNLFTLIEPFLILVLGICVLIIALGVFLPMWNLVQIFKA